MSAESWYNESRGEWSKIPGVPGLQASIEGLIKAGECVLTARYLPDSGLYVPVRVPRLQTDHFAWLPVHVLVAVAHLPNRPNYSWSQIGRYLSALGTAPQW